MAFSTATDTLRDRYLIAPDFETMLESVSKNAELWDAVWRRAKVPQEFIDRLGRLDGAWHVLVLSADWCGDAVNVVPVVARLAELSANVDMRILDRDANPDLMNAHLTGTSRSIPVVIALDEDFVERAWWGPRPSELQRWALTEGKQLEKTERYKQTRMWYARDRGISTLREVVEMIERGAGR